MATKYVCKGAECKCEHGSVPNFLEVNPQGKTFIQGKLMATHDDMTFKNPTFGTCKNNPSSDKTCTPIIVTKWENPASNVTESGKKALLKTSTTKCDSFQGKITITDPLQTGSKIVIFDDSSPPVLTPLVKQIVSVDWKNGNLDSDINKANIGDKVSLVVKTKNYKEGETVVVVIDEANGKDIKENTKQVKFSGDVNAAGVAVLKEEILIENANE